MASQSSRGSMFLMKSGFMSNSICSSSASFGCKGNAAGEDLHVLRAQVRKFIVSNFIVACRGVFNLVVDMFLNACNLQAIFREHKSATTFAAACGHHHLPTFLRKPDYCNDTNQRRHEQQVRNKKCRPNLRTRQMAKLMLVIPLDS